jgi:ATP-dependent DNA ligase
MTALLKVAPGAQITARNLQQSRLALRAGWLFERKYDGFRALLEIDAAGARLWHPSVN